METPIKMTQGLRIVTIIITIIITIVFYYNII